MKTTVLKSQRGVTLLEVLIAMIILSFALLLLLNMAMVALDGNDWSNKTTIATQLLQEKLEQLRSIKDSSLTDGSDTAQGFVRNWTVSNAGTHLREVRVQIHWEDIRAQQHVNSMTTKIRTDSV
ncbi:MAG TPA: prepilin-type N-terminal cleavage/methylation domain-containing protein [Acidobacteriota bacterium]|nr:prepilin-type N-terminal cleavage/methylation domain-containing protein [Acidobacteriota bacterium]